MTAAVDTRQAALAAWQEAAGGGQALSGSELAARYGRSPSWGRAVIREAREQPAETDPSDYPPAASTAPVPSAAAASTDGRAVAWLAFWTSAVCSLAGNLLSAWLPVIMASGAAPPWQQQAAAVVWPAALLLAMEVLTRTRWRNRAAGKAAGAALAIVAAGAAVISFGHLHEVLLSFGYGGIGAAVGPVVIDGLALLAGVALLSANADAQSGGAR